MARRGGSADERPVGIKDVAAAAGVSITTVSHALNGKGRLPRATRDHVIGVARELGYRASPTARHFATGRTGLIAFAFSPEIAQTLAVADFSFYAQLALAAGNAALERGYAMILGAGAKPSLWLAARPDGVIGVDPLKGEDLWPQLDEMGVPYVTVGRPVDRESKTWVDNDHRRGTRRALEHMRDRGAERIAVIGTGLSTSIETDIVAEYGVWAKERGHPALYLASEQNLTEIGGFEAMNALLRAADPPDGIYATVDRLALGAMLAARANAVSVPDELMVVACSDSEATRWSKPSVTAMDLKPTSLGRAAIELLTGMIDGSITDPAPTVVPLEIVERDSTSRPAPRARRGTARRGKGARRAAAA